MFFFSFINTSKSLLRPIYRALHNNIYSLWDSRLKSELSVKELGREIFKILDYGDVTRMRARTFETKEPETLNWIRDFHYDDKLLDIGANIGIYSLYVAFKGINVISIEPDSLNYALLNINIRINNYSDRIMPYCIAIHDLTKFSKFNISSYEW